MQANEVSLRIPLWGIVCVTSSMQLILVKLIGMRSVDYVLGKGEEDG